MNEPLRSAVAKPGMFYLSKKHIFIKYNCIITGFFLLVHIGTALHGSFFFRDFLFFHEKTAAGHTARRCFVNHIRE